QSVNRLARGELNLGCIRPIKPRTVLAPRPLKKLRPRAVRSMMSSAMLPESSPSRSRDGFGRARDIHYLVPVGTMQQFRNDGSAQMAAGATHTDFHVTSNTEPSPGLVC